MSTAQIITAGVWLGGAVGVISCGPTTSAPTPTATGDTSTSGGTTQSTPSTAEGSFGTTADEGSADETASTGDTGAVACPEQLGWQWIDEFDDRRSRVSARAIEAVEDGIIVLTHLSEGSPRNVLRHYDAAGLQSEQDFPSSFEANAFRVLPGGDVLMCGRSLTGKPGLWLSRHDATGVEQWSFQDPGSICLAVDVTASGDIVMGGSGPGDIAVYYRLDGAGNLIGSLDPNVLELFILHELLTVGEEVFVLGESAINFNSGFWFGRLDASDQVIWGESHFTFEGPESRATNLALDPTSGDIIVSGFRRPDSGVDQMTVWRFGPDGAMDWESVHPLTASEEAYAVQVAPDGTIMVAATSYLGDSTYVPLVAALSPTGALEWWLEVEGLRSMFGLDLSLDECGALYMTGWEVLGAEGSWVGRYMPER
ncbi:MAG: hypothetical protein K0V04_14170 [Deltaproteobacteria bacterium]|nr:hypothetical protein [Deltaproteobacteria bacterium]